MGSSTSDVEKCPASRGSSQYLFEGGCQSRFGGVLRGRNPRLSTLVPALLSQSTLMRMHMQTVIWQESADVVGDGGWDLMNRLQLFEPVGGRRQAERGRLGHQAELGIDVVFLFFLGELMPCLALELLLALLGGVRRWRRRRRRRMGWSCRTSL